MGLAEGVGSRSWDAEFGAFRVGDLGSMVWNLGFEIGLHGSGFRNLCV